MRRPVPLEPGALSGVRAPWALVGVRVWTGQGGPSREALAFGPDGRIAACGTSAAVLAALPDRAEVVDGRGATVCPGFVDPHVHVRACASAALATTVAAQVGPAELVAAVRHASRRQVPHGRGEWITLVGAHVESPMGGRVPDRRALDQVSRGAPVRIRDRTGHGWLFNSAALRRLGVDVLAGGGREHTPAGVTVERGAGGLATGFVADHVGWVGSRLGRVSTEAGLRRAVAEWSHDLARRGVAAVCDATATNDASRISSLMDWRKCGALRQEVTFLSAPGAVVGPRAARRHAGVKFAVASDQRLAQALRRAARTGLPVAVHCVGPDETATVLQVAASLRPGERGPLRLEHAAFVPPDWLAQAKALDATVVTHPSFIEAHGDRYLADPDLEPHDWLYRLRSWSRAGVRLAFASDAPFGPVDPLGALRCAASRRTISGASIGAGEALWGEAALRALTVGAARCAGLDRLGYGRLAPRGPGAAVVLSGDPRDRRALDGLQLIAGVIGGHVVD
ncbi:MAG TPA: amidohydrolase family protein [Solirubrobacteraceae bacterium]|nr:amidohydrolase family protein [Solirubrobacteraceae bacterium]